MIWPFHANDQCVHILTVAEWQIAVSHSSLLSSSPVRGVMSTPQLLKRLRTVLAREGDVRVELEKELANQISIISERGFLYAALSE